MKMIWFNSFTKEVSSVIDTGLEHVAERSDTVRGWNDCGIIGGCCTLVSVFPKHEEVSETADGEFGPIPYCSFEVFAVNATSS